jgi:hypothetical protein
MPLLLLPSTTTTADSAAISTIGSVPVSPLPTIIAITTVNDCHWRCYTVNNNDPQKPVVIVCC